MARPSTFSLVVAVVLAVAGCGGTRTDDAGVVVTPARLSAYAVSTLDAGSARVWTSVGFEGGSGPEAEVLSAFSFGGKGTVDFASGDGVFVVDAGGLTGGSSGGPGVQVEVRTVGGMLYVRMADPGGIGFGAPTEWVSLDIETMLDELGPEAASLARQFGRGSDPSQYFAMLGVAEGEIEHLGSDEVRGEATTRYRARIDLGRLLDQGANALSEDLGERLGVLDLDVFGAYGDAVRDAEVSADVWVDGDGRVRRIRQRVDMSGVLSAFGGGSAAAGLTMVTTVELSDFGVDVRVDAPPADEVTPFTDLFGGLFGGLLGGAAA